jgi:CHASE2 domain-containing sensor protein
VLYDVLAARLARPVDPSILIVEVDDRSLRRAGRLAVVARHPRPDDRHAQPGRRRTIVYDVLFSQPAADPADDQALAAAIAKSGGSICRSSIEPAGAPPRAWSVPCPPSPRARPASAWSMCGSTTTAWCAAWPRSRPMARA